MPFDRLVVERRPPRSKGVASKRWQWLLGRRTEVREGRLPAWSVASQVDERQESTAQGHNAIRASYRRLTEVGGAAPSGLTDLNRLAESPRSSASRRRRDTVERRHRSQALPDEWPPAIQRVPRRACATERS